MRLHSHRVVSVVALVLLVTGCDPAPQLHVESGSRSDSLLFHVFELGDSLAPASELSELSVRRCASASKLDLMWDLTRVTGPHRNERRTIRYGDRPDIYWRVHRAPAPLTDGCYVVTTRTYALSTSYTFFVDGDTISPSAAMAR